MGMSYRTDHDLTNAADKAFNSADLDKLQNLSITKVLRWIDMNVEFRDFCEDFSPNQGKLSNGKLFEPIIQIPIERLTNEMLFLGPQFHNGDLDFRKREKVRFFAGKKIVKPEPGKDQKLGKFEITYEEYL